MYPYDNLLFSSLVICILSSNMFHKIIKKILFVGVESDLSAHIKCNALRTIRLASILPFTTMLRGDHDDMRRIRRFQMSEAVAKTEQEVS